MFISNITLNDYRIYHGKQELNFPRVQNKNVFVISGNNGFGKTTLLNSLVWCLYGKQMIDVDDKFKAEIYEAGGYRKYAASNLNKLSRVNGKESYSVSITLTDISIPSLVCESVKVTRSFNISNERDSIEILIDGMENELTREVGQELFISDFILPKEIAKFFFFDAEKIVSLAEIKSIEDKRKLSTAYSEVLGIKKYEDLKTNLEDLRIRLRKEAPSNKEKDRYEELQHEINRAKNLVEEYHHQIRVLSEEKDAKKIISEQYQEKLIREGNSITLPELSRLKKEKARLIEENGALNSRLKDMLELAPFAIAGKLLEDARQQMLAEEEIGKKAFKPEIIKTNAKKIKTEFIKAASDLKLSRSAIETLSSLIEESARKNFGLKKEGKSAKVLLAFTDDEKNEFEALYNNVKYSFSVLFKDLTERNRKNKIALNKVIRKLSDAETKENDLLIREIRTQKDEVDNRIADIDQRIIKLSVDIEMLNRDVASKASVSASLGKKIELHDLDKAKDITAERLINELSDFILNLKSEKKTSLETRIKTELNSLMHKKGFIGKVEVEIIEDLIDIHLYDKKKGIIAKETLSKGEQQLYATALLKSLVDESNISFPVFIDSPLQKFDKKHSKNIIADFYPAISEQVVLFPLLEKELSEVEYHLLLPKINKSYLINHVGEYSSTLEEVQPENIFETAKGLYEYVY